MIEPEYRSVAEMRLIVENAEKVCKTFGMDPAETPWVLGLVSLEAPPPEAIEMGKRLAKEYGWK